MSKHKTTHQGVRDLNDLGGKRLNGKRPKCRHDVNDLYIFGEKEFRDEDGNSVFVNVLACSRCEEVLGPETELDPRIQAED